MIDTLGVGYLGPAPGAEELRHFSRVVPGGMDVRAVQGQGEEFLRPCQWNGIIPGLGRLTLNADGYVRHERSLVKTYQALCLEWDEERLDNSELLTADQCDVTFGAVTNRIEELLPWLEPDMLRVQRADVVYQRTVKSSYQTIEALKGSVRPTRGGVAWFDNKSGVPTGIVFKGLAVSHRVYDKGLESLNPELLNVLRSEEQLRSKSAAIKEIVNVAARKFERQACREVINERYIDTAYAGALDVSPLVAEGRDTIALLALHPELLPMYKSRVKRSGYYKTVAQVREFRATAVPDDLRVPEEAWT